MLTINTVQLEIPNTIWFVHMCAKDTLKHTTGKCVFTSQTIIENMLSHKQKQHVSLSCPSMSSPNASGTLTSLDHLHRLCKLLFPPTKHDLTPIGPGLMSS